MRGILVCAALVGLYPSCALADTNNSIGSASTGTHGHDDAQIDLRVTGHVSPKCEINLPNRRIQTALTDGSGHETVTFHVNCNQILSVVMTSSNGGLKHPTYDREQSFQGFTNFLPYRASLSVNANNAQSIVAESSAMIGGASGSIGVVPFSAAGKLELQWNPEQPLLGGTFEDVIEIRITGSG